MLMDVSTKLFFFVDINVHSQLTYNRACRKNVVYLKIDDLFHANFPPVDAKMQMPDFT